MDLCRGSQCGKHEQVAGVVKARAYFVHMRLHEHVDFSEPAGAASQWRLNVHRGNTRSKLLRARVRGQTNDQHRQALLVQRVELPQGARIGADVARQAEEDVRIIRD